MLHSFFYELFIGSELRVLIVVTFSVENVQHFVSFFTYNLFKAIEIASQAKKKNQSRDRDRRLNFKLIYFGDVNGEK